MDYKKESLFCAPPARVAKMVVNKCPLLSLYYVPRPL